MLEFTNRGTIAYDIINVVDGTREMLGSIPANSVQSFPVRSQTVGQIRMEGSIGPFSRPDTGQQPSDYRWRCIPP